MYMHTHPLVTLLCCCYGNLSFQKVLVQSPDRFVKFLCACADVSLLYNFTLNKIKTLKLKPVQKVHPDSKDQR